MSTRSTIILAEHGDDAVHVFDELFDDPARVWIELDASAVELATHPGAPGGRVTVAISRELWAAFVARVAAKGG